MTALRIATVAALCLVAVTMIPLVELIVGDAESSQIVSIPRDAGAGSFVAGLRVDDDNHYRRQ